MTYTRVRVASSRQETNTVLKLFAAVGVIAAVVPVGGWGLMLMVGVIHSWWPLVPTMPYTVALAVAFLKAVFSFFAGIATEIAKVAFK